MNFKEYILTENTTILTVKTKHSTTTFTRSDIQDELDEMNTSSDNVVGWLYRTLIMGMFEPDFIIPKSKSRKVDLYKRVIKNILKAVIKKEIKMIKIEGNFSGFDNLNPADYT